VLTVQLGADDLDEIVENARLWALSADTHTEIRICDRSVELLGVAGAPNAGRCCTRRGWPVSPDGIAAAAITAASRRSTCRCRVRGCRAYLPAAREESDMAETDEQPTVKLVVHCRRCNGWLMSPGSVAQRIGPTCAARERVELRAQAARELTLFDVPDMAA
jgi:hypothetical protein